MLNKIDAEWDVIVVGAGPTGLTLANMLGEKGVRTLLLEQLPDIIDYPRGVGMDDEALRSFQSIGLAQAVTQHTTPFHWARFVWPSGKVMASIEPRDMPFGWSRRNAFNQPLVDKELYAGLSRHKSVKLLFNAEVVQVSQSTEHADVVIKDTQTGEESAFRAQYIVGSDGGKSLVRETMAVDFDGITAPTRFVVVDLRNDPIGKPNIEFVLSPSNPYVSIALPGGIRRMEFAVKDDEIKDDIDVTEAALKEKYRDIFTDDEISRLDHIRQRVYTHHARIASTFRKGRLLLAGDAAHLMPVWQGQGYNTGIRDATNLGWKLAYVIQNKANEALLDTYTQERHSHSKAMIDTSVLMGKIFAPSNFLQRLIRDVVFNVAGVFPSWQTYITSMRWKPMPKFEKGALIVSSDKANATGEIFFQPDVLDDNANSLKLDDLFGLSPVIVSWGVDVGQYLSDEEIERWESIGGKIFTLYPEVQREIVLASRVRSICVFDPDGKVKDWFDIQGYSVYIVRPDRIIATSCRPVNISSNLAAFMKAAFIVNDADGDSQQIQKKMQEKASQ